MNKGLDGSERGTPRGAIESEASSAGDAAHPTGSGIRGVGGRGSYGSAMAANADVSVSERPAVVAMWLSYAVGGLGMFLAFSATEPAEQLEAVCLWSVGGLGVLSFVRHAVLHRSDAVRMGWDLGRRNNFQIEVGLANLAWGAVAIAAVAFDWGVAAQAVVVLVFGLYLLLAFGLHAISMLQGDEDRGAAGWSGAAATAVIGAAMCYFAVNALRDGGLEPFG